jgi:hypothetical protein
MGPRAGVDAVVKRKIPSPGQESNRRTPVSAMRVTIVNENNILWTHRKKLKRLNLWTDS